MLTSNEWPSAATAFLDPLRAHRRYAAFAYVPFVRAAAHAHWNSLALSHRLPFPVRPVRRLPALSWLPGHTPAHDARWPARPIRLMSVPISATSAWAAVLFTPGTVSSSSTAFG